MKLPKTQRKEAVRKLHIPSHGLPLLTLIGRKSALEDVAIKRQTDFCAQRMANFDRNGGARHGNQSTVAT